MNTSTFGAENLIKIGLLVSEIWPAKVKSQGARLFRQAHLFGKIWYSFPVGSWGCLLILES